MVVASEEPLCWSALDLRWVIDTALERGAHLLTAGEAAVVGAIARLPDAALEVYARLTARRDAFQRVEALGPHADTLADAGLIAGFVPWSVRARLSTVAELKDAARALGLPRSGNRDALVERVLPHTHWSGQRWVHVRHRGLVQRLERWAFLRSWPDRSTLVVERLGHVRWPDYTPTRGASLFPSRARLLGWEALLAPLPPEDRLAALEAGDHEGPGQMDLGRNVARHLLDEAREIERSGELGRAADLYARLAACSPRYATRALVRLARTLEQSGNAQAGLDVLAAHRPHAEGADRLALNRAGRRLARALRRGWAPDRPLHAIRERTLRLAAHEAEAPSPRPLWRDGCVIEDAVVAMLAEQGRVALHVEGGLWRTLFALLFAPGCYFLPVPGALPVPRLAGPLDLGSPAFARRRAPAIEAVRARIAAGEAPALVAEAYARFEGTQLAGCAWESAPVHQALAEAIGPRLLLAVVDPLLAHGFRAASGLPDLLVLPGPSVVLPRGIPATVGESLCLVEIKGPTDALSDAQRTWLDRLAPLAAAEVWKVGRAG
ncbi:MAG: VRR-NUC domain-containing protein [Alphaproteobacteria bacterium]|nr:VRR-NUC domain-containing protein [Alphaproteobacteria bacterium]